MYDLPESGGLQRITRERFERVGIVSSRLKFRDGFG